MFDDDEIEFNKKTIPANSTGASDDIADLDDLDKEALDASPEPVATKPPSRYAGKTQDELTQMLEDAQAQIGRQSSEIGEVRKLADDLVKNSFKSNVKEPVASEEHEDDFFTDPSAAVARAVSRHPAVAAAKEAAELAARERSSASVLKSHPDMTQVIGSPEFAAWVKASPMRVRMYAQADNYDAEAADELLTSFKSSGSALTANKAAATAGADKAASTLAAGSVGTTSAGPSATPSKKYRRSDIMRLMTTDPTRYEAMSDEILRAYSEGRVV